MGISEQSFDRWKKKYPGLEVAELRRLRQLEADLSLDKHMLKDMVAGMY